MSITSDYQRDWPRYFDAVAQQGPRDTLVRALAAWVGASPPFAIDVACGEGRDTRELLARAWRVFAFDATPLAIERLLARTRPEGVGRLTASILRFEDVAGYSDWPERADLINASFALPFCPPEHFPAVWQRLVNTLVPGGLFAGQFFGDRDEWAPVRPASHYSRERVVALFANSGLEFLHLEEVEKDGNDALMERKHHHLFHIVARKTVVS